MKLKVDKSEIFKWAIVVDEKDLRRLDETIKSIISQKDTEKNINIRYSIKCSDSSKVETSDINEVVNEENLKRRSIESIQIIAYEEDYANSINISLGDDSLFQPTSITYSITGDSREWVYLAASKIEERIEGLKKWYSFFIKFDFSLVVFSIVWVFIVFAGAFSNKETDGSISAIDFVVSIFGLIVIVIATYLIYKLIKQSLNYLFPIKAFRIGEGIKRHDAVIELRGKLFWAVFVGLIISTISGVILLKIV